MTPQQKILGRCKEIVEKARELYGVDLSQVKVSFDLRGRAAGHARGLMYGKPTEQHIRFNRDMLTREAFDHVLNDTVPHEYAHVICFMNPTLGRGHDRGWQRVCTALGGNGARLHTEAVVYGKGTTYEYTTNRGFKVRVGDKHHKYVQGGATLRFKAGKGDITSTCYYVIVGRNGQSLNTSIAAPASTVQTTTVVQQVAQPVQQALPGESKAAISRRIMLAGYRSGQSYEAIINAMIAANGYNRQLARATFKANAAKVGIADIFGV